MLGIKAKNIEVGYSDKYMTELADLYAAKKNELYLKCSLGISREEFNMYIRLLNKIHVRMLDAIELDLD